MPPTREEATRSPRSQAQRYETQGFWTAHFYFQVLLCVLLPTQCQAKTHVLFQVTCAVISLETMLGTRMAFLLLLSPSCRCINIRVGSVGGKEAHQGLPNHTYNNTAAGNVPPDSKSIPDLGGHRVRCILNSFPSNKAQTERSESGNPSLAYTRLFMRTLSVDLVSSLQAPGAPVSLNPSPPKWNLWPWWMAEQSHP